MTLYELLHKVSFDEIAPFLSKSYTEGKPLAPFKMHYVNTIMQHIRIDFLAWM